jgi:DNA-directed RNA polymerase II subunit RPB1
LGERQKKKNMAESFAPKGWRLSKRFHGKSKTGETLWDKMGLDKSISSIDFFLLSPEEIRRMSTVRIFDTAMYDNNLPHPHGIHDHRMGPVEKRMLCGTCGNGITNCNGHPGHIEFPFPVYHIGYIDLVLKLLRSCCFWCSRYLLAKDKEKVASIRAQMGFHENDEEGAGNREELFVMMTQAAKGKKICEFCKGPQPFKYSKYQHVKSIQIHCEWSSEVSSAHRFVKTTRDIPITTTEKDFWITQGFPSGKFDPLENSEWLKPGETVATVTIDDRKVVRVTSNIDSPVIESEEERMMIKRHFSQIDALTILKRIPDEDCALMGLDPSKSRPENMLIQVLLVGPPTIRPTIVVSEGSRAKGQDDLTQRLQYILKSINPLEKQLKLEAEQVFSPTGSGPSPLLQKHIDELQYHTATLINNDIRGIKAAQTRSGAPTKSIIGRLKGKRGRFRDNMMGKRVDFSARSTIVPECNIAVDEVAVPELFANKLTKEILVKSDNIHELTRIVKLGPEHPEGALEVHDTKTGFLSDLTLPHVRESIQLEIGWKVVRKGRTGDYVLFNRQPSLHKPSIMGHRVRFMKGKTIGMHPSGTKPYNADFDGDEMNLHMPQSAQATIEAEEIMSVPNQIVTPQSNMPVFSVVQDGITGAYRMTRTGVFFDRSTAMDMLMAIMMSPGAGKAGPNSPMGRPLVLPDPAVVSPQLLWTGKQLFSLILPHSLSMTKYVRGMSPGESEEADMLDPQERFVKIVDGEIVCGALCKATVGSTSGGIIHRLFLDVGPERAARFLTDCHTLTNAYNSYRGFSIGMSDCIISKTAQARIRSANLECEKNVVSIMEKAKNEGIPNEEMEGVIKESVTTILTMAGKIVQSELDDRNRFHVMVLSGAKGSIINETQVMGCVGQIVVEGKRVAGAPGTRLLPSFRVDDQRPATRGLVSDNFSDGVLPDANWIHSMGSREGLVDTAVKTAETGYIQRKLIKGMETNMQTYDGSIRNATGDIIQFSYGGDGLDATFLELASIPQLKLSDAEFQLRMGGALSKHVLEACRYVREEMRISKRHVFSPQMNMSVALPFDLTHLFMCAKRRSLAERKLSPGTAFVDFFHHQELVDRLFELFKMWARASAGIFDDESLGEEENDFISRGQSIFGVSPTNKLGFQCTAFLRAHVLLNLSASQTQEITFKGFLWVLEEMDRRVARARLQAGEMVGAIAAQSLAAPIMQMTLNSFHTAGITTKVMTTGVPRIKELIDVCKNPLHKSMSIPLAPRFARSVKMLETLKVELEYRLLRDVVHRAEIVSETEAEALLKRKPVLFTLSGAAKYVISLKLDVKAMEDGRFEKAEIADMIESFFSAQLGALTALAKARVSGEEKDKSHTLLQKIFEENALLEPLWTTFPGHTQVAKVECADENEHLLIYVSLLRNMVDRAGIEDEEKKNLERNILQKVMGVILKDVHLGGLPSIVKTFSAERQLDRFSSPPIAPVKRKRDNEGTETHKGQEMVPLVPLSFPQRHRLLQAYKTLNEMLDDRGYMCPKEMPAKELLSHMLNCKFLLTTRLTEKQEAFFGQISASAGVPLTNPVGVPPGNLAVFVCRDEKLGIKSIGACVAAMHKLNQFYAQAPGKESYSIRHVIILVDGIITSPARRKLLELQWKGRVNQATVKTALHTSKGALNATTAKAVLNDAHMSGYSMEAFTVDEFQQNISRHELVPKHIPLYGEARDRILSRFRGPRYQQNSQSTTHFPRIWCSDVQIRYLGVPVGTLIEVQRHFVNQQIIPYYRVVVNEDMR